MAPDDIRNLVIYTGNHHVYRGNHRALPDLDPVRGESPLLADALARTGTLLAQGWEGQPTREFQRGTGGWDDALRMDPAARAAAFRAETATLFRARVGAALAVEVGEASNVLLKLEPPTVERLEAELPLVAEAGGIVNKGEKRIESLSEVVTQSRDFLSFFGAQFNLHPSRAPWTRELLLVLYDTVLPVEMRFKLAASLPRPVDLAPEVQPILQTPAHGTYPSGHATEAFAFATLLALLEFDARGAPAPLDALANQLKQDADLPMPHRLAALIAYNRTVAGLHFPIDNLHGALLGHALALAFAARCGAKGALPRFEAAPGAEPEEFNSGAWRDKLSGWAKGQIDPAPFPGEGDLLAALWQAARAEWPGPGTPGRDQPLPATRDHAIRKEKASMSYATFALGSGALVHVQSSGPSGQVSSDSGADGTPIEWSKVVEAVAQMTQETLGPLRNATAGAKEVTVEFGIAVGLEGSVVVLKGTAEASLRVTLTWEGDLR